MAKISFYGGTRMVTGANYLLELNGLKILVDCGLFQGSKFAEVLNYEPLPYAANDIDFVFITHGHADHMGRLPKLFKEGFRGKIYGTKPTAELIRVALPDSLGLIEEEASRDNHESLFNIDDMTKTFELLEGVDYERGIELGNNVKVVLHDAGHILGSAIIEINWQEEGLGKKIYFTGDLGNAPMPLLNPPYSPKDADYIVVESAYGDRIHEDVKARRGILSNIIIDTIKKGGTVLIPSFAIERTQEILFELHQLFESKILPPIPVFLDSPLAIKVSAVYNKFNSYFSPSALSHFKPGDGLFNFKLLKFTETTGESKKINDVMGPKIIIAGSGMSNGGRILHHEQRYLSDPNSTIIFIGYQVVGSMGRKIYEGAREVSIFGQTIPVRCRVEAIGGYSAHADKNALLEWIGLAASGGKLKKVFVVQGEEGPAVSLAGHIKSRHKVESFAPEVKESFEL